MTVVKVKGQTEFGYAEVEIRGDSEVREIICPDPLIRDQIKQGIRNGDGVMANDYHPEPDTMLQAFAFLIGYFPGSNVTVDGNLETAPYEEGVIY